MNLPASANASGQRPRREAVRRLRPLRALFVFLCLIALLFAVALWRLVQHGLPLDFLQARIEQTLEAQFPHRQISIDTPRLAWDDKTASLLLQLRNVRLSADGKAPAAQFDSLLLGVNPRALLRQRIRLDHVIVIGGFMEVQRRQDSAFDFPLATTTHTQGAQDAQKASAPAGFFSPALLPAMVGRLAQTHPILAELQRLEIRNGELRFRAQASETSLNLRALNLELQRSRHDLGWQIATRVQSNADIWHLQAQGRQSLANGSGEIRLQLENLMPSRLARLQDLVSTPPLLRALQLPLRGQISLRFDAGGALHAAEMEMDMGKGAIHLADFAPLRERSIALDSGRLRGRYDADENRLLLDEAHFLAPANRISLNGSISLDAANMPKRLELQGEDLRVHIAGITEAAVPIERLDMQADVHLPNADLTRAELHLERLRLLLPAARSVNISGSIIEAPQSPQLRLAISAEELNKDEMMSLWPLPLETATRDWVRAHASEAMLRDIRIRLNMDGGALAATLQEGRPLAENSLFMETGVHALVLDYLPPLPPIRNAEGGLRLRDNRFDAWAETASVQASANTPDIALNELEFSVTDTSITDPPSTTRLSFRGEANALLTLLQGEFIGLGQKDASIDAMQSAGTITGDLTLAMRLYDEIEPQHLDLAVTAGGANLLLPVAESDYALSKADLDFTANLEALSATGTAHINDVPVTLAYHKNTAADEDGAVAIHIDGRLDSTRLQRLGVKPPLQPDGRIPVSLELQGDRDGIHAGDLHMDLTPAGFATPMLGWHKPKGQRASLRMHLGFADDDSVTVSDLRLHGEDVEVQGALRLNAQGRLQRADFPVLRIGADTSLALRAQRRQDGLLALDVSGQSLDLRDMVDDILGGEGMFGSEKDGGGEEEEASEKNMVETLIGGRMDRLLAHDGIALEDARFFLRQAGDHVKELQLDARLNGETFQLRLQPADEADNAGATGGGRRLRIFSGDGGATLKGLDLYPHVSGGILHMDAEVSPIGAPLLIRGTITGSEYRVTNAPGFARLLSLASLSGIADLLTQSGIFFRKLELPFEMTAERINLLDGDMSGPSLGLTLRGEINHITEQVDLHGALVPSYVLNSLLGNIPLLGELIVGRQGEGIFGVTFLISGPVDDVSIVANPFSVLTPGILRRLTEFGDTPPQQTDEEDPPAKP